MQKETIKKTFYLTCLILIWASSWSINKLALQFTPPLLFTGLRALLGGIFLSLFLLHHVHKVKWRENWKIYFVSSFLNVTIFFGLQTVGLVYLPGGLFSVLVYLQPVLVGIFAWIWLGETMTFLKIIGFIIGFSGIFIIGVGGLTGEISFIGVILGILTAIGWAFGVIYLKKVAGKVDSIWLISLQAIIGGITLLLFGSMFESWTDIVISWEYIFGLSFGATLGLPVSFIIYYSLVNSGEASKVASFTFLVPVVSVLIGNIFLNEPITLPLIMGLIFIVISISVVNYNGQLARQPTQYTNYKKSKNKKSQSTI